MDAIPCHQDFQMSDGHTLLLQYVSKYVSKFSDHYSADWLNDEASADCIARRVLFQYHPLEPEMALQLHGARYKCWDIGTVSRGKREAGRSGKPVSQMVCEQPLLGVPKRLSCHGSKASGQGVG